MLRLKYLLSPNIVQNLTQNLDTFAYKPIICEEFTNKIQREILNDLFHNQFVMLGYWVIGLCWNEKLNDCILFAWWKCRILNKRYGRSIVGFMQLCTLTATASAMCNTYFTFIRIFRTMQVYFFPFSTVFWTIKTNTSNVLQLSTYLEIVYPITHEISYIWFVDSLRYNLCSLDSVDRFTESKLE